MFTKGGADDDAPHPTSHRRVCIAVVGDFLDGVRGLVCELKATARTTVNGISNDPHVERASMAVLDEILCVILYLVSLQDGDWPQDADFQHRLEGAAGDVCH